MRLVPKRKLVSGLEDVPESFIKHQLQPIDDDRWITGAGITKLSELEIDVDKSWVDEDDTPRGITNLKEVADSMAKGDLAVRHNTVLVKLTPGPIGWCLISLGPGKIPTWGPCGAELARYIPVPIELAHAEAIASIAHSCEKTAAMTTSHKQAYGDAPADYIKRLTPAVGLIDAEAIASIDQTHNKDAAILSGGGIQMLIDGACAEDGGVFTDETAEAIESTTNDMTLLPACTNGGLVVNDAYYFGFIRAWTRLWLNVSTEASGNFAFAHEYWDGDSWELLSGLVDDTDEFCTSGTNKITWTIPGDWATTNDGGNLPATLYWMRARVTAVTTYTQQPLGAQAWCEVLA